MLSVYTHTYIDTYIHTYRDFTSINPYSTLALDTKHIIRISLSEDNQNSYIKQNSQGHKNGQKPIHKK
jgi:hypothetical protein